jgi:hypothetical protein
MYYKNFFLQHEYTKVMAVPKIARCTCLERSFPSTPVTINCMSINFGNKFQQNFNCHMVQVKGLLITAWRTVD